MNMAAGKMKGPRLIIFTAITLAVMRQVIKRVVMITNRCETFMLELSLPGLNQAFSTKEKEHSANKNGDDEEDN